MALNFKGLFNLFRTSRERNVGLSGQKEVPAGYVKDKLYRVSIPPPAFIAQYPDTQDISYGSNYVRIDGGANVDLWAPITLPHGGKIISAIVYGVAAENWALRRLNPATPVAQQIFLAQVGTRDTSPAAGTDLINNSTYSYLFQVYNLDSADSDIVYGAEVEFIFEDPETID